MTRRLIAVTVLLVAVSLPVSAALEAGSAGPGRIYLPMVGRAFATVPPSVMVLIPAGTFQMGCDEANPSELCQTNEKPLHTVYLDAYHMDKTEVTNAQYERCVTAGGCAPSQSSASMADHPVTGVDWHQADAYCAWAGKRLPTEAEWEKVARGGSGTRMYPWGNQAPDCSLANFWTGGLPSVCVGGTSAVGSHPGGASPYGVLDMAGNVFEWVADWYSSTYYTTSPASNPTGPSSGTRKVWRGGSWNFGSTDLRVASRDHGGLTQWHVGLGFRCATGAP
jgi:formylglycine-generating enzyme required for sulfatase activity